MTIEYITVKAKYNYKVTQNLKKVLQTLRKHSFFIALDILSDISNRIEKNIILQILYSTVTYAENNHYANLIKIWIDDIYIKNISKPNYFINKNFQKLEDNYFIIINLGFEYKAFPVKKESIW
uniref:Uncharacterized protein n=1 Tax=Actinocyclus subtilis TaxID=1630683 RepID=A0A2U9NQA0_9STRA|nr:hypothetical protein ycf88 [Actinocyclus subtilis]AWT39291.1 hypothetical protein ycf88 [Actinocyclus subtilis]